MTDWSFEASHPAVIDQLTITKIVKGLYSNDDMKRIFENVRWWQQADENFQR